MAPRNVTLAFAGAGSSTLANTTALLNDFLGFGPDDAEGFPAIPKDLDLHIVLPVFDGPVGDGLLSVLDWTEYADLPYSVVVDAGIKKPTKDQKVFLEYAQVAEEVTNVNKALVDALREEKEAGREVYAVLLWGEEGDDNSEVILDLVASLDIKAMDLTAGLDDLGFGDEEMEAAPEPEPEPEPEAPRARGSRRKAQPLEAKEEPLEAEPEEKPARRTRAAEKPAPEEPTLEAQVSRAVARKQVARKQADAVNSDAITQAERDYFRKEADLVNRFSYHPADDTTAGLHEGIRKVALDAAFDFDILLPDGREKDEAIRKIEEAMFWANAAVARSGAAPAAEQPVAKVVAPEPAESPAESPSEAPSRGRGRPRKDGAPAQPRSAVEKAVMEIWDEDAQEWVKKGRGRAPKDAKTRMVDPSTGDVVTD